MQVETDNAYEVCKCLLMSMLIFYASSMVDRKINSFVVHGKELQQHLDMFSLSWNNVEDRCWFKTWTLAQMEDELVLLRYNGLTYVEICWTYDHDKYWKFKIEFTFSTQKYIDRSNGKNLKNIICT